MKETYHEKITVIPSRQYSPVSFQPPEREIILPSSNITLPQLQDSITIREITHTVNDQSQTNPIFAPQPPEPSFFQKIKNFIIKYSIILGIICFLFPSVGVFIVGFLWRRTRTAMSQLVGGIQEHLDSTDDKVLKNTLSKKMDGFAKKLVKKLK
ncbi:MAG: hypothetical protein VKL60_00425 [Sphaerospermopsis sp.]|nr:hypothetical protein [Sphaerospermopsis sp.]